MFSINSIKYWQVHLCMISIYNFISYLPGKFEFHPNKGIFMYKNIMWWGLILKIFHNYKTDSAVAKHNSFHQQLHAGINTTIYSSMGHTDWVGSLQCHPHHVNLHCFVTTIIVSNSVQPLPLPTQPYNENGHIKLCNIRVQMHTLKM